MTSSFLEKERQTTTEHKKPLLNLIYYQQCFALQLSLARSHTRSIPSEAKIANGSLPLLNVPYSQEMANTESQSFKNIEDSLCQKVTSY